jgi:hypothetical protein
VKLCFGQRLEKVSDQQSKMVDKIDKKISQSETRIFKELRERESKRLNVVMHGVEVAAGTETSGERRVAWDTKRIAKFSPSWSLICQRKMLRSPG